MVTGFIFLYLVYKLGQIGWQSIFDSLPKSIVFYLLTLVSFFILPIAEVFIYRLSISFKFWQSLRVFVFKKIMNTELISYSGEAYLYNFAQKYWGVGKRDLVHVIKDNTIISVLSAYVTAATLLLSLMYFQQIDFLSSIHINKKMIVVFTVLILIIFGLFFYFHDKVTSQSRSTIAKTYSIHQIKHILMHVLSILQYSIALPEIPLNVWFIFIAGQVVFKLIPFIPSQDIAILGLYAKISENYGVSQAKIMALFISIAAFSKLISFSSYVIITFIQTRSKITKH